MKSMRHRAAARTAALLAFAAAGVMPVANVLAAGKEPVSFEHKDWGLQCDNTLTCHAVGYQSVSGEHPEPVSIRLTREAGPDTPVVADLQAASDGASVRSLRLQVGKLAVSARAESSDGITRIPADQVPRVVQELLRNDEAIVTAGKQQWHLSLAGASAVLLKMDEAQGRLGTPGALVRRGTRPESSVPAPVPMPVFNAVLPVAQRQSDDALAAPLLGAIDRNEVTEVCNGGFPQPANVHVHRLTERKVLLEIPCGMGAYNSSGLLWMADDRPPYRPQPLEAEGGFYPQDGSIRSSMKVRGLGDCWSMREWHFNGRGFVLTQVSGDSMCRGFAGGAWQLPSFVSKVVLPAKPVSGKP